MGHFTKLGLVLLLPSFGCAGDAGTSDGDFLTDVSGLEHGVGPSQFAGGFSPTQAPWGGFGGGNCDTSRVPVIFINGNGSTAEQWDFPPVSGEPSVYETFIDAGYNPCELFGVNWLSPSEQNNAVANFHDPSKRDIVADFIADVLAYTGATQVDVMGHSMGVTIALEAIEHEQAWSSVRRFINISGALRGLDSCLTLGYANPLYPTCGSQNLFDSDIFGFYPHSFWVPNWRMGNGGFRDYPSGVPTDFYSINAGVNDQFHCAAFAFTPTCSMTGLFDTRSNVRAQLDVGHGSTSLTEPEGGGDIDGVGHFRARNDTGPLAVHMLNTSCAGSTCCAPDYGAPCE